MVDPFEQFSCPDLITFIPREAAKKVIFLGVRPLRGEGGEGGRGGAKTGLLKKFVLRLPLVNRKNPGLKALDPGKKTPLFHDTGTSGEWIEMNSFY